VLLKIDKIECVYLGALTAVSDLTLAVPEGKSMALLGSNGAGKSTVLKSVSGVLATEDGKLNTGDILFEGKRLNGMGIEDIARLGICHVLQGHPVFEHLTVEDNLKVGGYRLRRLEVKTGLERVYAYFPRLWDLHRRQAGYLSGGEQQMLVIGRGLMARPRLMLLDEPSLGLAPGIIPIVFEAIRRINREEGMTVLLAEQNVGAALAIADLGCVLQNGRVVAEGPADTLKDHARVREFYLGAKGATKDYYRNLMR
jgi:branched-chain amino acid transport system ATP-binding protein